jgi:hypothetical protein
MRVRGSLLVLQLFDVSEGIRMDTLGRLLGGNEVRRGLAAPHLAQTKVWFEPPPAIRALGEIEFVPGERFNAEMHYYSYGVVCLRLERSFDLEWQELIDLCARWVAAPMVEAAAAEEVRRQLAAVSAAL